MIMSRLSKYPRMSLCTDKKTQKVSKSCSTKILVTNTLQFQCPLRIIKHRTMHQSSSSFSIGLVIFLLHFTCSFHRLLAKSKDNNSTTLEHRHFDPNARLHQAYVALQAWKLVIYSDPSNRTSDWVGPSVCDYTGVYCAPSVDDPHIQVVAGIDLNHADIAGFLPDELGLLSDLALFHVNSNRFCGILPLTLAKLTLLHELDLSNNRFVGRFPMVVLDLPFLKYLDLRYNEFEGPLPSELFAKDLDAIFVNNNRLTSVIPSNISGSTASVIVFANNNLAGCLPPSIAKLADSLEELLLINTNLSGCLTPEVGFLYKLRVLDVSFNNLVGPIPYSIARLEHLEQLDVAHNMMSGVIPAGICSLPNLKNFTFSYNYFCDEEGPCQNLTGKGVAFDDRQNCLPEKKSQRSKKDCEAAYANPIDCFEYHCGDSADGMLPPPPLPSAHP